MVRTNPEPTSRCSLQLNYKNDSPAFSITNTQWTIPMVRSYTPMREDLQQWNIIYHNVYHNNENPMFKKIGNQDTLKMSKIIEQEE